MNILKTLFKYLTGQQFTLYMDGGGSSNTGGGTSVSELPEWARGYAKDTLAKGAALTDINQNKYQNYGGDRIAGFSPMQQQAMQGAADMQTGPEAFQKGVTGYMNPYIEQALKPQIAEANRGYDVSGQKQAGQATQAGAFGGSRDAIMRAENERNRNMGIQNIVGQGYNTAYNNAQNQYNTGFNQNIMTNQLQNQYGAMQQNQAQKGLDTGYQDFLNQQNYPYKQIGFMSDLLRGMPMGQSTTKSMYEPNPGLAQQIGSVGMGAYGISKLADGGMAYADGGGVDSQDNISRIASKLSDQQLQQAMKAAQARGDMDQVEAIQSEMGMRASERNGLASAVTPQMADQMAGGGVVAFAQGGSSATLSQLSTLANTDLTETPEQRDEGINAALPGVKARYGDSATAPYLEDVKKERAGLGKMSDEGVGLGALAASQALLRPGSSSRAISGAMGAFGTEVLKMKKEQREADRVLRQSEITLATAEQARKDGLTGKAESLYDKAQDQKAKGLDRQIGALEKKAQIEGGLEQSHIQASATLGKKTDLERLTDAQYAALIESGKPANAATRATAAATAADQLGRYPGSARAEAATTKAMAPELESALLRSKPYNKAINAGDYEGAAAIRAQIVSSMKPADKKDGSALAPQATAKGPDLNTFMAAAKKANPGVSDADLKAYYDSKYK